MTALAWAAPVLALTKEERLLLWVGVLVGVLLFGAVFIGRIDRWRQRQMEATDDSPEHLGSFRAMYERGEISKGEYERVLRKMAEHVGAKPKPASAPTVPPSAEPNEQQEPPATPPA